MNESTKLLSFAELEELYRGQFDWLASQLIGPAIDAAIAKMGRHVTDPVTGKPQSFRLDKNFPYNGKWYYSSPEMNHGVFNLVEYVTGMGKRSIFMQANAIAGRGTGAVQSPAPRSSRKAAEIRRKAFEEKERLEYANNHARIKKAVKGAFNIRDARAWPGMRYLAERGLTLFSQAGGAELPSGIGFHPSMRSYRWDENNKPVLEGEFPTILCKVTNGKGELVTFHRIYLQKDGSGKAPVESPKKAMPPARKWDGSSIKMYEPDEVLAVAEGVETAFAVREGTGLPVWATVHASGLAGLEIPEGIKVLAIFADKDRSLAGEEAANRLKERAEQKGIKAVVLMPPLEIPEGAKSVDWLDVWNQLGGRGFTAASKEVLGALTEAQASHESNLQTARAHVAQAKAQLAS